MATPHAFIPVLGTGATNLINTTDHPSIIVAHVLQTIMNSPADISPLNADEVVSFRQLESQHGKDRERLSVELQQCLHDILGRYFPDSGLKIQVTHEAISTNAYRLNISIRDKSNVPLLSLAEVSITDKNIKIDYPRKEKAS